MFRIGRKIGLAGAMAMLPLFGAEADTSDFGKYLCVVSHMAGIQTDADGKAFSGKIQPTSDKFFLDIHQAAHPPSLCGKPGDDFSDWFLCKAKFEVQINSAGRLRSDTTVTFIGPIPIADEFILNRDMSFYEYQNPLTSGGAFVSDGQCSKL